MQACIKLERADLVEGKKYTVSHYVDGKSVRILCLWITYRRSTRPMKAGSMKLV